MQVTLSSKGQLVLPVQVRRRLRLKPRSKLELEMRKDGVFLRAVKSAPSFEPIEYLPPGALKVTKRMIAQDKLFSDESL